MSGLILITRPLEEAKAFAKPLQGAGYETMIEPMLTIEPVAHQAHTLKGFGAVIFTSAHGVQFWKMAAGNGIKAYCVGEATARAAANRGYEVINADGNAASLIEILKRNRPGTRLLYIRGQHGAYPVTDDLKAAGFDIEEIIVYNAFLTEFLNPICLEALKKGQIEAVTFFSKRTAENFTRLMEKNGLLEALKGLKALSISQSVLESVRSYEWAGAYAAQESNTQGMLRLIKDVCLRG